MLTFPAEMTISDFLRRHWQKQPLFMPAALPDLPLLGAEELAWLATQPDVESRLVFTERLAGNATYRLEHGPFESDFLAALPDKDWTLLVQDVEKHLPELRSIFAQIPFIPEWRIDDLMISFATPGGSVGPHLDQYDVFLCQLEGTREWQVARELAELTALAGSELSLVQPFTDYEAYSAAPGDVLYLPPGRGHWGVAKNNCLTYSIGMRAPSAGQLAGEIARQATADNGLDERYTDADLLAEEAEPGRISTHALQRAQGLLRRLADMQTADFALIFGAMVTDPKAWLAPATMEDAELTAVLAELPQLEIVRVHGMAQLAFSQVGNRLLLFANGFSQEFPDSLLALVQRLCQHRELAANELISLCEQTDSRNLMLWLFKSGIFEPVVDVD